MRGNEGIVPVMEVGNNNGNGSLTVSGGATSADGGVATLQAYCPDLKVGDVVTLNAVATADIEVPKSFRRIYIYGIKMGWSFGTSKTITQEMLTGGRVGWYYAGQDESGERIPATISNIQIEYGTTATEYEPYIPTVTTNIYLDEPLRGIGNYRDYIEVRNRAVKKYQNIGTATENVTDAKPNSEYLGTMTQDGTADESGSITVQDGETVYYILSTPIATDITDTVAGQTLLSINTEYGKTKTLTVTGTDMTTQQCKLNTQEV